MNEEQTRGGDANAGRERERGPKGSIVSCDLLLEQ